MSQRMHLRGEAVFFLELTCREMYVREAFAPD